MKRKNAPKTYTDKSGKFAKGNPGRPEGARHKTTRAVEALLAGDAEALTRKVVEVALKGDTTALRLCLERIVPVRKDCPVQIDLPEMSNAIDAAKAAAVVLQSVAVGNITPLEGASVMGLIDSYRRTLEVTEIETRIKQLEEVVDGKR
jgi:hypothetical protein